MRRLVAALVACWPAFAAADGLRFVDGRPEGYTLVRLELDGLQRPQVRAFFQASDPAARLDLDLSPEQSDALFAATGRRVTWLDAGTPRTFADDCTCNARNLAVLHADHVEVLRETLDPARLPPSDVRGILGTGALPPRRPEPAQMECGRPASLADFLDHRPEPERTLLAKSLRSLVFRADADPPGDWAPVSILAPGLLEDDEGRVRPDWFHDLAGDDAIHLVGPKSKGLLAKRMNAGAWTIVVFRDLLPVLGHTADRALRLLAFEGTALRFSLLATDGGLRCEGRIP